MNDEKGIFTRIKIENVKGAELAYLYEHNLVDLLPKSTRKSEYEENFLNVGDTILLSEKEYKIVNIFTKSFAKTIDGYQQYGINLYGIGEQLIFFY